MNGKIQQYVFVFIYFVIYLMIDNVVYFKFYIEMHYVRSRFQQFVSKHKASTQGNKFEVINDENGLETELELCKKFDIQYLVSTI